VVAAFATDAARFDFFATLNAVVGSATLAAQVFLFAHVLRVFGFHGTLLIEPVILMVGLAAAIVHPGLLSIAVLDGGRKIIHYALLKPTKEGLYAALPAEAQFIAKPLLDTFVYRLGSLIGAGYFTATLQWGMTATFRRLFLVAVSLLWAANSWRLGAIAERSAEPAPA
jgi:AAA family ATP:ADP antiporter